MQARKRGMTAVCGGISGRRRILYDQFHTEAALGLFLYNLAALPGELAAMGIVQRRGSHFPHHEVEGREGVALNSDTQAVAIDADVAAVVAQDGHGKVVAVGFEQFGIDGLRTADGELQHVILFSV